MSIAPNNDPVIGEFSIEDAEQWRLHDKMVDYDLRYFEEKTGGGRLARRADLKPEELTAILPEIAIFQPIYDATGRVVDVKALLEGTKLDSFYGSITNKLISDYPYKAVGDRILLACKRCVEVAKPIVVVSDTLSAQKDFLAITVLYIPMSEDGTVIDRIFIHNQIKSRHRD